MASGVQGEALRRSERHMSQQEKTPITTTALDIAFTQSGSSYAEKMASMEEVLEGDHLDESAKYKSSLALKPKQKMDRLEVKIDQMSTLLSQISDKLSAGEKKYTEHDRMCEKFTNALFHDNDGLEPRFQALCHQVDDLTSDLTENKAKVQSMEATMDKMKIKHQREVEVLRGTIERQQNQIKSLQYKAAGFTARSMDQNLTFTGIKESASENCKGKILKFLDEKLEIKAVPSDIQSATRMGVFNQLASKPRTVLVKCSAKLKDAIMQNTKKLKGQKEFFVSQQLPDLFAAEKRSNSYISKFYKDANDTKPVEEQQKVELIDKSVFIDGESVEEWVQVPTVSKLLVSDEVWEECMQLDIKVSQPKTDTKSIFTGYAIKVGNLEEVERAYTAIKLREPAADHVMMAYNVDKYDGFRDDGEHNAGVKLHMELTRQNFKNVAVFVSRVYGGSHLGARRFQHIVEVAQIALAQI